MTRRPLALLATAALGLALTTGCTPTGTGEPTPTATTTSTAPSASEIRQGEITEAQDRLRAYNAADDKSSNEGYADLSFVDEYVMPELAEEIKVGHQQANEAGITITGETELGEMSTKKATQTEDGWDITLVVCADQSDRQVLNADGTENAEGLALPGATERHYWMVKTAETDEYMLEQYGHVEGETCAV